MRSYLIRAPEIDLSGRPVALKAYLVTSLHPFSSRFLFFVSISVSVGWYEEDDRQRCALRACGGARKAKRWCACVEGCVDRGKTACGEVSGLCLFFDAYLTRSGYFV